jgi:fumarylpyruvate hydrolase
VEYVLPPLPPVAVPVAGSERFFPVHRIYCVGRNYAEHAREMGGTPEREPPFFFSKPADAVVTAAEVPFPPRTTNLHHEVELVVALGSGGFKLPVFEALSCIFGYGVGVDLTRRDLQTEAKKSGRPWDVAKGFDHSAPVSPICPASECGHPRQGEIVLSVNDDVRQRGDIADMIWSVPEIIATLSGFYELRPGDLIFTGTPVGVGPLQRGDRVAGSVAGIGRVDFTMSRERT